MRILMVEDNPGDAFLMRQAFTEAGLRYTMTVAANGDDALRMLLGNGKYAREPRPDLILLDLNLPGKSGHDVLRDIKENPAVQALPVIVFSSSEAEADMTLAYDLHANCYIRKPTGLAETLCLANSISTFWFSTARLPRCPNGPSHFLDKEVVASGDSAPALGDSDVAKERILKWA